MGKCIFIKAWIGRCENDALERGYCVEHDTLVCCSCGEQAIRECDETMGLVCGCSLCDDCEHEIAEDGSNGYIIAHCKKTEQKYLPWYVQEMNQ